LLAGCKTATLTGDVRATTGAPIAGARLDSPGCEAVSDETGAFRVACPAGTRTFRVSHPAYLDATWVVSGEAGLREAHVGAVELAPIPAEPGLWLPSPGQIERLPDAPLRRTERAGEQRWCMDSAAGEPTVLPPGAARLLDNHAVDWRVFRLDDYGCAYRLRRSVGGAWIFDAEQVAVGEGEARGPGRAWVELALAPGDYAIVEWYDGFLVPADEPGLWRAHWLRVGVPESPAPGDVRLPTPTLTPAD
jgi:hypothetical protein